MSYFGPSTVSRSLGFALPGLAQKNFPFRFFPLTAGRKTFTLLPSIPIKKTISRNFAYTSKNLGEITEKMALQAPPKELMAPMNVPQKLLMVNVHLIGI